MKDNSGIPTLILLFWVGMLAFNFALIGFGIWVILKVMSHFGII